MSVSQKKKVVIFGFKDASVGLFIEMFKILNKFDICYFVSINPLPKLDIESEHKSRPNSKTEFVKNNTFLQKPVFYTEDFLAKLKKDQINNAIVLEEDVSDRLRIIQTLIKNNINVLSFIHETSFLGGQNLIESGTIIFPMCFVGYKTDIKLGTIIQQNSSIGHHSVIGKCCNIETSVTTNGFSSIGDLSTIHSSATIINRINIGKECKIGAGSLVIKNCQERSMYVGTPARKIKEL